MTATSRSAEPQPTKLPRLLYLGDVPVEASYHGSALLYRLLESYPAGRLMVIEAAGVASRPERRLKDVAYQVLASGSRRLQTTRLHAWWSLWQSLRSASWADQVPGLLGQFSPDAVLTVAHGDRWVTAAEFARRRNLPLHLIVHDDWPGVASLPPPFSGLVDRQFSAIYRAAASRLCVSPWMVEEYRRRYGVDARVLYPSRALGAQASAGPPERLSHGGRQLTLAFAGTINTPDYYRMLATLAQGLQRDGGRLLVFGPISPEQAAADGLAEPNVVFCGLVSSAELMARMRAEVDVLVLPMSFAETHAANMKVSFPSKLTDYTAVGLPLLICGPEYCSAVRWARANPGVAEIVGSPEPAALLAAVERLAADPGHRVRLGQRAHEVGEQTFSHEAAWAIFADALAGAPA